MDKSLIGAFQKKVQLIFFLFYDSHQDNQANLIRVPIFVWTTSIFCRNAGMPTNRTLFVIPNWLNLEITLGITGLHNVISKIYRNRDCKIFYSGKKGPISCILTEDSWYANCGLRCFSFRTLSPHGAALAVARKVRGGKNCQRIFQSTSAGKHWFFLLTKTLNQAKK